MWKSTGTITGHVLTEAEAETLKNGFEALVADGTLQEPPAPIEESGTPYEAGYTVVRYWQSESDANTWRTQSISLVPDTALNAYVVEEVAE